MLTSRHAAYALVAVAIILGFLLFGIVVANAQVLGPLAWIASAGVTALSFAAGFLLMRALTNISPNLPLVVIGLATGQADIGGLL